jgi:hypothetical protein
MSPEEDYLDEAQVIVNATHAIKSAIVEHGFGTTSVLVIMGQLMKMTQLGGDFMQLPESERDEFFAAVFDAAIGNEPNALVNKIGIFEGDVLEQMSDAVKAGALAYFNRELPATT